MVFKKDLKENIKNYIDKHIETKDELYNKHLFRFIKNKNNRDFAISQFYSTRYIYKFLEGIHAQNELLSAEAKIQVITYLSFIEYSCDQLMSNNFVDNHLVQKIIEESGFHKVHLNDVLTKKVCKSLNCIPENIAFSVKSKGKTKNIKEILRNITFKNKLECISSVLLDIDKSKGNFSSNKIIKRMSNRKIIFDGIEDLIIFRNDVHLSHEINNSSKVDIDKSKKAYKLVFQFSRMINNFT